VTARSLEAADRSDVATALARISETYSDGGSGHGCRRGSPILSSETEIVVAKDGDRAAADDPVWRVLAGGGGWTTERDGRRLGVSKRGVS
jgi:hypothetical protein